uniref:Uncharacterized protein n=1 Tax=Strongyloides venezuelensis TaxID=75913 RepID=A0A0K0G5R4_STRVS
MYNGNLYGIIIILIFTCKLISPVISTSSEGLSNSTDEIKNEDKKLLEKYNLETDSDKIFIKCLLTNFSGYQNFALFINQNYNNSSNFRR